MWTVRKRPVNTGLLEGELAWRQHDGGHKDRSNMSCFIAWADPALRPHVAGSVIHEESISRSYNPKV